MLIYDYYHNASWLHDLWRKQHRCSTIGFLPGEFDLFNAWHEPILQQARSECDLLIVALWEDDELRNSNGENHPVASFEERAEMLLATQFVNYVVPLSLKKLDFLDALDVDRLFYPIAPTEETRLQKHLSSLKEKSFELSIMVDESVASQALIQRLIEDHWANETWRKLPLSPLWNLPILQESELLLFLKNCRKYNIPLSTTNGSFDIIHPGHVRYLKEAQAFGGQLLVLVNDDASITERKGPTRPVFNHNERMRTLAMLECVDWVIPFRGDNPLYLIDQIQPRYHIKGGSFEESRIAEEKKLVESHGGEFKSLELIGEFSSTNMIQRLKK